MTGLALALLLSAAEPKTIAIAYFDNAGDPSLDALKKGLADMLISDFAGVPSVRLVERERLAAVLDELRLKRVDPKSALKVGKVLAAHFILTGTYQVAGGKMRIDARVIEVATGAVAATTRVESAKEDFFAMEKDLVEALVKAISLPLTVAERDRLRQSQTESFSAFEQFSKALDAMDLRQPDRARALFEQAIAADPAFQRAHDEFARLGALTKGALAHQDLTFKAQLGALRPDEPGLDSTLFGMVNDCALNVDQKRVENLAAVLGWIHRNGLKPKLDSRDGTGPFYFEALQLIMLTDKYVHDPEIEAYRLRVRAYLKKKYAESQPVQKFANSEQLFTPTDDAQAVEYVKARRAVLQLVREIVR